MSRAAYKPQSVLQCATETPNESQLVTERRQLHKALSSSKIVNTVLARYIAAPRSIQLSASPVLHPSSTFENRQTTKQTKLTKSTHSRHDESLLCNKTYRGSSATIENACDMVDPEITLALSPFPRRRPTLWFTPYDHPWDGDTRSGCRQTYVRPSPLPLSSSQEEEEVCEFNLIELSVNNKNDPYRANCTKENSQNLIKHRKQTFPTLRRIMRVISGPYSKLSYVLGDRAVPFTALVSTLEKAGFHRMAARKALVDSTWSLKWIKHPLPSDFKNLRIASYQKLNHLPGTWRLGRKDTLHRALCSGVKRWKQYTHECRQLQTLLAIGCHREGNVCKLSFPERCSDTDDTNRQECVQPFCQEDFPKSWLLPEEYDECKAYLRDPLHSGEFFIVKPAASACGKGVYILKGGPNSDVLPSPIQSGIEDEVVGRKCCSEDAPSVYTTRIDGTQKSNSLNSLVVQQYISDPYLVHGYKFDLRLYVVITSYEPARFYLYKEGLVRFATSPYYETATAVTSPLSSTNPTHANHCRGTKKAPMSLPEANDASTIADVRRLTAHLTNFTLNKKSEDFVIPCYSDDNAIAGTCGDDYHMLSKWSLAALRAYMEQEGVNWEATMERVEDLLCKVFLSIAPEVREETRKLDLDRNKSVLAPHQPFLIKTDSTKENADLVGESFCAFPPPIPPPPCTVHGISPFFEIFGVDVLLRHSSSESDRRRETISSETQVHPCKVGRNTASTVLKPVIIEVNIMPSLSTHYSPLDQCIKGNFIADTLNLIGLTSMTFRLPRTIPHRSCGNLEKGNKKNTPGTCLVGEGSSPSFSCKTHREEEESDEIKNVVKPDSVQLPSTAMKVKTHTDQSHLNASCALSERQKYGDYFLDEVLFGQPSSLVEACLVSEEERLRAPHFKRLIPTPKSFSTYKPLFLSSSHDVPIIRTEQQHHMRKSSISSSSRPKAGDAEWIDISHCNVSWQSLDEVLSAWEAWREKNIENETKE